MSVPSIAEIETPDSFESLVLTIPNEVQGKRLDQALSQIITDFSRNRLTNWMKQGLILIDNKIAKANQKVMGGEIIIINQPLNEDILAFTPEDIPLDIIYDDEHILIINKPAGLTVHPGNGNWSGTLLNGLLFHYPQLQEIPRAGIVHRLDKDTTGLMVVAKTLNAQISLVQQLQDRSVSRIYRAIVEGNPHKQGIINKPIGRDSKNRTKMTTLSFGGKEAITKYRVLQQFEQFSYVECKLETGRTHQIRVHFKSLGYPLVGDETYGTKKINYPANIVEAIISLNRQALHALKLSLIHPYTHELMHFKSRLPEDMRYLLAELNKNQYPDDLQDDEFLEDDNGDWEVIYAR